MMEFGLFLVVFLFGQWFRVENIFFLI